MISFIIMVIADVFQIDVTFDVLKAAVCIEGILEAILCLSGMARSGGVFRHTSAPAAEIFDEFEDIENEYQIDETFCPHPSSAEGRCHLPLKNPHLSALPTSSPSGGRQVQGRAFGLIIGEGKAAECDFGAYTPKHLKNPHPAGTCQYFAFEERRASK